MTRFVAVLPVLMAVLAVSPTPAFAQHAGHTMMDPTVADPHAAHNMPGMPPGPGAPPAPTVDPHAVHRHSAAPTGGEKRTPRPGISHGGHGGHAMSVPVPRANSHAGQTPGTTMPPGAHTGHNMRAMPSTAPAVDPHAGHTRPGMAMPPGPHAGHMMTPMGGASPGHAMHGAPSTSDPHAGHPMPGMAMPGGAHAGHSMDASAPSIPQGPPPAEAFSGPRYAADGFFDPANMSGAREQLRKEQGDFRTYKVLIDRLESRFHNGRDGYLWDAQGWYGGDIDRLWIKTEGEGSFGGKFEEAEFQALWGRAISPWWDLQAGARHDIRPGSDRSYGVLGIQGLAPYYFEVDAAAFLSTKGDVTARLEAEYDQLITQKLILQPRLEMNLAAQDVRELDIGAGLSSIDAGLRLRYEFVPEFAPYIGVEYSRKLGKTARFARDDGEDVGVTSLLVGLRMWF